MKHSTIYLVFFAALLLMSCKKVPTPNYFIASQGSYIGVVHLAYDDLGGEAIVSRFNEDNAEWQEITWTWSSKFADNGYLLPDHYIIPGKEYRYKMQVYKEGEGAEFSDFTHEITGYAYKAEPVNIISINRTNENDNPEILLSWRNPNDLSEIKNLQHIEYCIYRAEDGNLSDFRHIDTEMQVVTSPSDIQYEWTYRDNWLDSEKTYSYKIKTRYLYNYTTSSGDYRDDEYYEVDGITAEEGDSGNDDNPTVNYTTTDMGQLVAAASGEVILDIKEKVVNEVVYLGIITGSYNSGGKPALFKKSGSVFENVWTCDDLSSSNIMHYAVNSSGTSYVAGYGDSLCIYKREGYSWSQDIAPDGIDDLYGIELFNNELYLFAEFDDRSQVKKYNGATWDKIGEDMASVSIFNANIETTDGNLYVHYTNENTLHIKHLSGSSWVSDLEWTQEWLSSIELAKNGSNLYFSTSTLSTAEYAGGVYKITSSTSVENLIPEGADESWFLQGAFTMAIDADGNLISCSIKAELVSDSEVLLYPNLILYDGSQWNTVSGDYTDGRDPIGISTVGNEIYYFYGEKATQNASNQSTVLKAKKLNK